MKANEYIEKNFSNYFQIYTDGSVQSNLDAGIGVVWKEPGSPFAKIPIRANSRRGKCTTSVELEAIASALGVIGNTKHPQNVIITDSLSSLEALQNKPNNNYWVQNTIRMYLADLRENGITVELCHVPSHCGVTGNELADLEANRGSKMSDDINENYNKLSRTEGYRLLNEAAKRDQINFPTFSDDNFSKKGIFPKYVTPHTIFLYRRLKFKNPLFHFYNKITKDTAKCPHCNSNFNVQHFTSSACQTLIDELGFVQRTLVSNNTDVYGLLDNTTPDNWRDALYMCDLFKSSSIGHLL